MHRERVGAACNPCWPRAGFTLIEVVVAITLGSLVLLGARMMFVTLAEHAAAVERFAAALDRSANAERQLRAVLGQIELGVDEVSWFRGTDSTMHFTTWCEVPGGWTERCRASLAVDPEAEAVTLRIELPTGDASEARLEGEFSSTKSFRYLQDAGNGGHWLPTWDRAMASPLAVGLVTDRDTLIIRIGERG